MSVGLDGSTSPAARLARLTELCEGVVEELDPEGTPPTAARLRRVRL